MSNSLNLRLNQHFYLGFEAGFGYAYVDRLGDDNSREFLTQIGMKIGYAR